jgi:hypothetical protein
MEVSDSQAGPLSHRLDPVALNDADLRFLRDNLVERVGKLRAARDRGRDRLDVMDSYASRDACGTSRT